MDEDSFKNPFLIDIIRWIFTVGIIFSVFTINPYNEKKILPLIETGQMPCKIKKTPLPLPLNKSEHSFYPIILQAASKYKVDPALVKAIIKAESGYNPMAVSRKGAMGLMQLMPGTAKDLGVEDSFNPESNINAGVKYFKQLLTQFNGNVEFALAAYNAGSRRVRQHQGIPPFKATRCYIKKVFEYYYHYKKEMGGEVVNV